MQMKKKYFLRFAAILALAVGCGPVQSAVILSGSVPGGTGVFTITEDLVFTITTAGNQSNTLIFDGWGNPSDAANSPVSLSSPIVMLLNGSDAGITSSSLSDNFVFAFGGLTPTDSYLYMDVTPSVVPGDIITIKAGSWALSSNPDWNPAVSGSFVGNAFLVSFTDGAAVVSDSVAVNAVPAPSPLSMMLSGVLLVGALGKGILSRVYARHKTPLLGCSRTPTHRLTSRHWRLQ